MVEETTEDKTMLENYRRVVTQMEINSAMLEDSRAHKTTMDKIKCITTQIIMSEETRTLRENL